ncbi:hypothetical protein I3760_06G053700 [Carya illinoinensis]|nr:hypothetical protein I3760_06G053700 [Carya illinoinensis]
MIENRRGVNIWKDSWIPGFRDLKYGWWNVLKERRMLPPIATDEVLKIIISLRNHEDQLIWELERSGFLSVKSAYRLFRNMGTTRVEGEISTTNRQKQFWKIHWQPPPEGTIKLNVDGANFHKENTAGVGIILRDSEGKFCIHLGLQALSIEVEFLLLVKDTTKSEPSSSILGNIVIDIKQLMKGIPNCSIPHINREDNQAAHKLARFARNVENTSVWWDSGPSCIQQVLWTDLHL